MVSIKGYELRLPRVKDSHTRRAQRSKNAIITSLRAIGISEDDIEIDLIPVGIRREPAKASWWIDGHHLYYSYKGGNFAENIAVIALIIEREVRQVLAGEKTLEQFILDFNEEPDVEETRKAAREHLGVDEHASLEEINKAYKQKAKQAHPDMPTGDTQTFKDLNKAHKILRRELG